MGSNRGEKYLSCFHSFSSKHSYKPLPMPSKLSLSLTLKGSLTLFISFITHTSPTFRSMLQLSLSLDVTRHTPIGSRVWVLPCSCAASKRSVSRSSLSSPSIQIFLRKSRTWVTQENRERRIFQEQHTSMGGPTCESR